MSRKQKVNIYKKKTHHHQASAIVWIRRMGINKGEAFNTIREMRMLTRSKGMTLKGHGEGEEGRNSDIFGS